MMLTFEKLRLTNITRCEQEFKHPLKSWSVTDWGCATVGEAGEACNIAKKILRLDSGLGKYNHNIITRAEYVKALGEEIADMVIYSDLWAASENLDLAAEITAKFNKDSRKHGTHIRL